MKSFEFLFWAYNVVWIGLAGYLFWVFKRLRQAEQKLEKLNERVAKKER